MVDGLKSKMRQGLELFNRYAPMLMQIVGLDNVVWLVFFYLFQMKVYVKDSKRSSYDIYTALSTSAASSLPLYEPKSISSRSVNEALEKLVAVGFVKRIRRKREENRRVRGLLKKEGRPPKFLYELKSVPEIIDGIRKGFREKERKIIEIFSVLGDIEEAAGVEPMSEGGV